MKLDQFQQIQSGSIYRGLTPLTDEQIEEAYGARALALDYVEGHLHGVRNESLSHTFIKLLKELVYEWFYTGWGNKSF